MDTLVDAIESLKEKGYTDDLNMLSNAIECKEKEITLTPKEFVVDDTFRFEGKSNPSDMSIVYAIRSEDKDIKGVLIHPYGTYSEPLEEELLQQLQNK